MRDKYPILLIIMLLSSIATAKELNLNDIKWPPFFFPQFETPNLGIAKEILNICITNNGNTINYKTLPIKRTHLYMKTGELDISIYSFKESRKKYVVYGKEPIFESEYGFASRVSDNIEIKSLNDIHHFKFGHLAGLSHTPELMEIVEEKRADGSVTDAYDLDAMFGQLLASPQRFQVMASSKDTFSWRAKQLGIRDKIKIHDFTIKTKPYFITVSKFSTNIKDIPKFLDNMDKCLLKLKQNGQYKQIQRKYLL